MHVAPDPISPFVSSGAGARWRYVKSRCRGSSRATSSGWGSLTLTIISASPNTASASGRVLAPWARYCASRIAEPSPAPACTTTSCPASTSSRTPAGVSATRYSSSLTSAGTPTFTLSSSGHELAPAQGEPELDAVARAGQVAPGELLHLADPVAERVAVAVEPLGRTLPLPVLLDEGLE